MNKKAYSTNVFGFFFVLMVISGLFMFLTFGMHFLLYDYGIKIASDVGQDVLTPGGQASTAIGVLRDGYLDNTKYFDILFLVIIMAAFIQATWAAILAREAGWLSFFGFITIGNFFLVFIMGFAIQIQGWFLNEIFYRLILIEVNAPIMTAFFNYSNYIGVLMYLWLVTVNQLDLKPLIALAKENVNKAFGRRDKEDQGRFEQ